MSIVDACIVYMYNEVVVEESQGPRGSIRMTVTRTRTKSHPRMDLAKRWSGAADIVVTCLRLC
jgi:hypothetical protein